MNLKQLNDRFSEIHSEMQRNKLPLLTHFLKHSIQSSIFWSRTPLFSPLNSKFRSSFNLLQHRNTYQSVNQSLNYKQRKKLFDLNTTLQEYAKNGQLNELISQFESMKKDPEIEPNTFSYSVMIYGAGQAKKISLMESYYREMLAKQIPVSQWIRENMIRHYSLNGFLVPMLEQFYELKKMSPISWRVYNLILYGLEKAGRVPEMLNVFDEMRQHKLHSIKEYKIVITGIIRPGHFQVCREPISICANSIR